VQKFPHLLINDGGSEQEHVPYNGRPAGDCTLYSISSPFNPKRTGIVFIIIKVGKEVFFSRK
jgi:hypothetical protein